MADTYQDTNSKIANEASKIFGISDASTARGLVAVAYAINGAAKQISSALK